MRRLFNLRLNTPELSMRRLFNRRLNTPELSMRRASIGRWGQALRSKVASRAAKLPGQAGRSSCKNGSGPRSRVLRFFALRSKVKSNVDVA